MKSPNSGIPAGLALSCLFAALCCAGAYISIPIPIGPVPLSLSNFFAVLGGLLLGPLYGALSIVLYLALGALGFPVFSGGSGGLAHFIGPTGGYLLGYAIGAFLAGAVARRRGMIESILGSVLGFASILAVGAVFLKFIAKIPWDRAMIVGILPFIVGDSIKTVLAVIIALRLGPFVDSLTGRRVHGPA